MTVIDVHTHAFTQPWLELLKAKAGIYNLKIRPDGQPEIFRGDTPVVIPQKGHFDWKLRIQHMDQAGVDVSVVSLTCPNVYWGGEAVSVQAAREANDNFSEAQRDYPDRIRWFASLPWEYPQRAVEELERCCAKGAAGVMVLANVAGRSLTDPMFSPIWQAIDALADGDIAAADIGTADDRAFVHQFSAGLHARMVRLRNAMTYRSRMGKIAANTRAAASAFSWRISASSTRLPGATRRAMACPINPAPMTTTTLLMTVSFHSSARSKVRTGLPSMQRPIAAHRK